MYLKLSNKISMWNVPPLQKVMLFSYNMALVWALYNFFLFIKYSLKKIENSCLKTKVWYICLVKIFNLVFASHEKPIKCS